MGQTKGWDADLVLNLGQETIPWWMIRMEFCCGKRPKDDTDFKKIKTRAYRVVEKLDGRCVEENVFRPTILDATKPSDLLGFLFKIRASYDAEMKLKSGV